MSTTTKANLFYSEHEMDAGKRRRIVLAAGIGTAIEYYDFTIYAFLAATLSHVFFPSESATAGLLSTFAVFALSFFLRPIGGVLVGHLGDKLGRRRALTITVSGMIFASCAIGLTPGFSVIGLAAPLVLVAMRCIQGLSAGGELGTAASYVAEESPDNSRGYLTGLVNLGTVGGTVVASLTVAIVRMFLDEGQMVSWGWRLPFLLSLPLGVVALIIRMRIAESVAFTEVAKEHEIKRAPVLAVVTQYPAGVLRVFALALTSNASYWTVFAYMGTFFRTRGVLDAGTEAWVTTSSLALAGISMPFWCRLSDVVGRKTVMAVPCALFVILSYPLFVVSTHSPIAAILTQLVLGQITASYLANLPAVLAESLPTSVRVSGFSLGYNLASIVAGGSASYIATWLILRTGNPASPAFFLMAATFLSLLCALMMRETAWKPLQRG